MRGREIVARRATAVVASEALDQGHLGGAVHTLIDALGALSDLAWTAKRRAARSVYQPPLHATDATPPPQFSKQNNQELVLRLRTSGTIPGCLDPFFFVKPWS